MAGCLGFCVVIVFSFVCFAPVKVTGCEDRLRSSL